MHNARYWLDKIEKIYPNHGDQVIHSRRTKGKELIERIQADAQPEWQAMDSAPKDGTMILVRLPRMMNLIVRARYDRIHKYWLNDYKGEGGICKPYFFHSDAGDVWHPMPKFSTGEAHE